MTMKLDHSAQAFVISCDSCPESWDTEHVDWYAALGAAKKEGWRVYVGPDKEYAHSCPACTEDFAKSKRR
jgi:hypothetical protein